jgi:hypothetical protein
MYFSYGNYGFVLEISAPRDTSLTRHGLYVTYQKFDNRQNAPRRDASLKNFLQYSVNGIQAVSCADPIKPTPEVRRAMRKSRNGRNAGIWNTLSRCRFQYRSFCREQASVSFFRSPEDTNHEKADRLANSCLLYGADFMSAEPRITEAP